jgi:hypothetical protein
MDVLADRPEPCLSLAPPDADDRELAVEPQELLGKLAVAERFVRLDNPLALAVVPQAPRLDERGEPRVVERPEARRRDAERAEQLLLAQPVLAPLEGGGAGDGRDPRRCLHRHVLELVGDDVGACRKAVERLRVPVLADEELADRARAGVRGRVEEAEVEPQG